MLGYLSGLQAATNVTGGLRLDPLAGTSDAQGVWAWIDNFCRLNPLETIEWAAFSHRMPAVSSCPQASQVPPQQQGLVLIPGKVKPPAG